MPSHAPVARDRDTDGQRTSEPESSDKAIAPGTVLPRDKFLEALQSTKARWIVIQVFAEACGPCMTEALELSDRCASWRDQGIAVIGLGLDPTAESVRAFDRATGGRVAFPLYSAPWFARQHDVLLTPTLFIYDRQGRQCLRTDGEVAEPDVLTVVQQQLDKLRDAG